jgi:hypothetical protein
MKLMTFERLEPYAVKVSSTVLRRGRSREASSLSDKKWRSYVNQNKEVI